MALKQNSVSFLLVHQSMDADNDRITVVVVVAVVVVDDDDYRTNQHYNAR